MMDGEMVGIQVVGVQDGIGLQSVMAKTVDYSITMSERIHGSSG